MCCNKHLQKRDHTKKYLFHVRLEHLIYTKCDVFYSDHHSLLRTIFKHKLLNLKYYLKRERKKWNMKNNQNGWFQIQIMGGFREFFYRLKTGLINKKHTKKERNLKLYIFKKKKKIIIIVFSPFFAKLEERLRLVLFVLAWAFASCCRDWTVSTSDLQDSGVLLKLLAKGLTIQITKNPQIISDSGVEI